jgi:hypothetical protein
MNKTPILYLFFILFWDKTIGKTSIVQFHFFN